jgi:hypothetical protein
MAMAAALGSLERKRTKWPFGRPLPRTTWIKTAPQSRHCAHKFMDTQWEQRVIGTIIGNCLDQSDRLDPGRAKQPDRTSAYIPKYQYVGLSFAVLHETW